MAMQSRQPPGGSSSGLPAMDRLTGVQENLVPTTPRMVQEGFWEEVTPGLSWRKSGAGQAEDRRGTPLVARSRVWQRPGCEPAVQGGVCPVPPSPRAPG